MKSHAVTLVVGTFVGMVMMTVHLLTNDKLYREFQEHRTKLKMDRAIRSTIHSEFNKISF